MTAKIIAMPVPDHGRLECPKCGVTTPAACDCGEDYVPVLQRAAEAKAKNPGKSNRTIATELGVSTWSVNKAARERDLSPERVKGKDNKSYPAKRKAQRLPANFLDDVPDEPEPSVEEEVRPENYRTAYLIRVSTAMDMATDCGKLAKGLIAITRQKNKATKELIAAARRAAQAWEALAKSLEE